MIKNNTLEKTLTVKKEQKKKNIYSTFVQHRRKKGFKNTHVNFKVNRQGSDSGIVPYCLLRDSAMNNSSHIWFQFPGE